MKLSKTFTIVLAAICLALSVVSTTSADISNAAVLFLRIAPGARPAGMGEAFVAIADDATATHWNPAGLGSYPLADSWKAARIPDDLKPISALTALKKEGGKGYLSYDLWALTSKGVARYDNKDWYLGEVFSTRTDESISAKVKAYFNITDEEKLFQIVKKVARVNSDKDYDFMVKLRDTIVAKVPANYNMLESLKSGFDSLLTGYDQCLINWSKVKELEDQFNNGMKDGKLSEQESDRINFAVERSRARFIPEELFIPYSAVLDGKAFDIAASLELLLVATTENLYAYDGRRWRPLHTPDDSVKYGAVNTLFALDQHILVGTDNGLLIFSGAKLHPADKTEQLPTGSVTAIGAHDPNDVWIVLNNDLYHYNGATWSNSRQYTAVLDDTPESIATKFGIYGTPSEKQNYVAKLKTANRPAAQHNQNDLVDTNGSRKGLLELMQEMKSNDSTSGQTPSDSAADGNSIGSQTDDSTAIGSSEETSIEEPKVEPAASEPEFTIHPGDVIQVPYLSEIRGKVNAIQVSFDDIWLGTSNGIVHFDGKKWEMPGYRDTVIAEQTTIEQLASSAVLSDTSKMENFKSRVTQVNDLSDGAIAANTKIKVPHNPAASAVNEIGRRENKTFFATSDGLLEYDGQNWRRTEVKDMEKTNTIDIRSIDNEMWVANQDEVVIKANGRTELSTMYVKWLPELADDLYYVFLSAVAPKSGWGTFGGNMTFISYGKFSRTLETGPTVVDQFESFDFAATVSFGTALSEKWSFGVSAKVIYSKLADQGAAAEKGKGTSTGFALDGGVLYHMTHRLTWGAAITNVGPKMTYIDAAQADDLPRNLGFGFAYKLLQSDYYRLLFTAEMNKILVSLNDGFKQELKETVFNSGAEFMYANIFAIRAGYIYDQDGNIKNLTLGAGLSPLQNMRFDFSYIPSNSSSVLANTLRLSLSIAP